jgi:hypothetical protein
MFLERGNIPYQMGVWEHRKKHLVETFFEERGNLQKRSDTFTSKKGDLVVTFMTFCSDHYQACLRQLHCFRVLLRGPSMRIFEP